jgi:phosphoglycolate phosphatase
MIVRAILFDLDGTLIDSIADLTDAVNHLRNAFSHPPLPMDAVRERVGKGSRNLMMQVLPGVKGPELERALSMFLDFNRQHIADKSRLYPGIMDMLQELDAQHIKMAVVSNKNESLSTCILQSFGIQDLFASISGGDTFTEMKPSPLPLLTVIDSLGIDPDECVMAGDSINDIQAGNHANIATIACTWGYGNPEELAGADAQANSPRELLALVAAGIR